VLVEIEGHDVGEVQTLLAVHPDQLAVDPDGSAAGAEAEHGMSTFAATLFHYFGDPPGDCFCYFVVLDDYDRDAFSRGWHRPLNMVLVRRWGEGGCLGSKTTEAYRQRQLPAGRWPLSAKR